MQVAGILRPLRHPCPPAMASTAPPAQPSPCAIPTGWHCQRGAGGQTGWAGAGAPLGRSTPDAASELKTPSVAEKNQPQNTPWEAAALQPCF